MMREIIDLLKYCFKTRRAWWFTAVSKTKARYARTILGSLWLGISTLFTILCLGFIYGNVFKVENLFSYFLYLGFWTINLEFNLRNYKFSSFDIF